MFLAYQQALEVEGGKKKFIANPQIWNGRQKIPSCFCLSGLPEQKIWKSEMIKGIINFLEGKVNDLDLYQTEAKLDAQKKSRRRANSS
jgi:hypothetical protein